MFEGPHGKQMMIQQGYVLATCTLPDEFPDPLIYFEVIQRRSPCWGCNDDGAIRKGHPKQVLEGKCDTN